VSTAVNKAGRGGSKGPELIQPLADHSDQPPQLNDLRTDFLRKAVMAGTDSSAARWSAPAPTRRRWPG
jgi:hypothetical protein